MANFTSLFFHITIVIFFPESLEYVEIVSEIEKYNNNNC